MNQLGDQVTVVDPNDTEDFMVKLDRLYLEAVHDSDYVQQTIDGQNDVWYGNKPKVGEAAFAMFRGTMRATDAIIDGHAKVAFNPQGAKHHARQNFGAGFCAFNDMVYAAKAFQAAGLKPLYLDWDIHAGDGVFHMLKGSGVATISIHVGATYPHDPELNVSSDERAELHDASIDKYNFNLRRYDGDDAFIEAIDKAAKIIDDYKPDVILLAAGADGHTGESNLGLLANYTAKGFEYAANMVATKALEYSQGRVLIGGAGGYQPFKETPETWALVVSTIYNQIKKGV